MKPTNYSSYTCTLVTLFIALCLMLGGRCAATCGSYYSIKQESGNEDKKASSISQYDVNVIRQEDCSLLFIERIVFPNSLGGYLNRSVWVGSLQRLTVEEVLVNNRPAPWMAEIRPGGTTCGESVVYVQVPPLPNRITVEYRMALNDGVMEFTKTCGVGERRDNENLIRWTSGAREDTTYDRINLEFTTNVPGAELYVVGRTDKASTTVSKTIENRKSEVEVYIAERGADICKQEAWCIRREFVDDAVRYTPAVITIFVLCIALVLSFIIFCLCAPCCARSRTHKNNTNHRD